MVTFLSTEEEGLGLEHKNVAAGKTVIPEE